MNGLRCWQTRWGRLFEPAPAVAVVPAAVVVPALPWGLRVVIARAAAAAAVAVVIAHTTTIIINLLL